ncbi:MAG: nuclear transport factor 2 family protein [Actinomycetes bacterium]
MSVRDVVAGYYEAWADGKGDFSGVPLAPDFAFTGPVGSFDSAEGFRAMAGEAGPLVTRFVVRRQFVDGGTVCSIIDWEMALPVAPMTSAEILQVRDGEIVTGELIYDAQELRGVMAARA